MLHVPPRGRERGAIRARRSGAAAAHAVSMFDEEITAEEIWRAG
jgi:hypothetical protein